MANESVHPADADEDDAGVLEPADMEDDASDVAPAAEEEPPTEEAPSMEGAPLDEESAALEPGAAKDDEDDERLVSIVLEAAEPPEDAGNVENEDRAVDDDATEWLLVDAAEEPAADCAPELLRWLDASALADDRPCCDDDSPMREEVTTAPDDEPLDVLSVAQPLLQPPSTARHRSEHRFHLTRGLFCMSAALHSSSHENTPPPPTGFSHGPFATAMGSACCIDAMPD